MLGYISPPTRPRSDISNDLAADVAAFLAAGNDITEVPPGASSTYQADLDAWRRKQRVRASKMAQRYRTRGKT